MESRTHVPLVISAAVAVIAFASFWYIGTKKESEVKKTVRTEISASEAKEKVYKRDTIYRSPMLIIGKPCNCN